MTIKLNIIIFAHCSYDSTLTPKFSHVYEKNDLKKNQTRTQSISRSYVILGEGSITPQGCDVDNLS